MPYHDLRFDAGRCSEQETTWVLDKNDELDSSVPFNDGGMVERYQNDKWNGLEVIEWNTNAESYAADSGYIKVTVSRGIPRVSGTSVKVFAKAGCNFGPFAAGNWMWGVLRIHTRPFTL